MGESFWAAARLKSLLESREPSERLYAKSLPVPLWDTQNVSSLPQMPFGLSLLLCRSKPVTRSDTVTTGSSSSVTVTVTPSSVAPSYSVAPPATTACATVWVSSAASSSCSAVTVTVCAVFHDDVENVNDVGSTPTSPPPVTLTVTSPVGTTLSSTV